MLKVKDKVALRFDIVARLAGEQEPARAATGTN
jgi:hypothetical protein